tara:strand:+ start:815 stop:1201 length:387 start_codon:yes stop_codon:yes gene_type:complete
MAKIVSKSRKKPDIVVPHSNKSVTNSLINDVINDFFIYKHTPDSLNLDGVLFTLTLNDKKFVYQEIKLDKDIDYTDIYLQGTFIPPDTYNIVESGNNIVISFNQTITGDPGSIVVGDFEVRGKIVDRE